MNKVGIGREGPSFGHRRWEDWKFPRHVLFVWAFVKCGGRSWASSSQWNEGHAQLDTQLTITNTHTHRPAESYWSPQWPLPWSDSFGRQCFKMNGSAMKNVESHAQHRNKSCGYPGASSWIPDIFLSIISFISVKSIWIGSVRLESSWSRSLFNAIYRRCWRFQLFLVGGDSWPAWVIMKLILKEILKEMNDSFLRTFSSAHFHQRRH